jgi:hypothetical protein
MQTPGTTELALRDLHLPDAIGWWPPAMGWWILLIAVPSLLFFCYWLIKRITRKTAIKSGTRHLAAIKQNPDLNDFQKLQKISMLVRRITISHFSRTESASLTGQQWLSFLDKNMPDKPFSNGIGRLLITAPYQQYPVDDLDIDALIKLCAAWLKSIKRGKT